MVIIAVFISAFYLGSYCTNTSCTYTIFFIINSKITDFQTHTMTFVCCLFCTSRLKAEKDKQFDHNFNLMFHEKE